MALIKRKIEELLVDNGQITAEELSIAELESRKTGESIRLVLSRLGYANENLLKNTLELEYGVNYVCLTQIQPEPELLNLLPETLVRRYQIAPISQEGNRLTVAMVTPDDSSALEEVKKQLDGFKLKPVVCLEDDFIQFLKNFYDKPAAIINPLVTTQELDSQVISSLLAEENNLSIVKPDLVKEVEDEAIILLANQILSQAIKKGVSNIHIQCQGKNSVVRYRINSELSIDRQLPKALHVPLVARYKLMAKLNILEHQLPQDGHIRVRSSSASKDIQCRVSFVLGAEGEHVLIWID